MGLFGGVEKTPGLTLSVCLSNMSFAAKSSSCSLQLALTSITERLGAVETNAHSLQCATELLVR